MKIVDRDPPHAQKQRRFKQNRPDYVPVVDKIHTVETKIRKEIAIMKKCRHPHVVRLIEVIDDRQKSSIYMIMEFLEGGEISWKNLVDEPILSVDQSRRIIRDAILGLEYLHHHGIIHRDIKPANLVWSKNREHVKIADFGVAHFSYAQRLATAPEDPEPEAILLNDSELAQRAGTPPFLAPEVVYEYTESYDSNPGQPRPAVTKAIDIWALGVTLYCFLFGRLPFKPPSDTEGPSIGHEAITYRLICNSDWEPLATMGYNRVPTGGRHPDDEETEGGMVIHLLDHCLTKDPQMRITLSEVKRSRWFICDLPNPEIWLRLTDPQPIQVSPSETTAAMSKVRWRWRGVVWDLFRNVRSLRSQRVVDRNPLPQPQSQSSSPTHQRSFSQILGAPPPKKRRKKKTFDETSSWPKLRTKSSDPMRGHASTSSQAISGPSRPNHGLWSKIRRKPPSENDVDGVSVETPAPASSDINYWRGRRSVEVLSPHHRMQVTSTKSDLSSNFGRRTSSYADGLERAANLTRGDDIAYDSRAHSFEGSLDEKGDGTASDSQEHLTFSPKKRR